MQELLCLPLVHFASVLLPYAVVKVHAAFGRRLVRIPTQLVGWWAQVDSNHRPRAYQARALTS